MRTPAVQESPFEPLFVGLLTRPLRFRPWPMTFCGPPDGGSLLSVPAWGSGGMHLGGNRKRLTTYPISNRWNFPHQVPHRPDWSTRALRRPGVFFG
jgi:hypothetical protein